MPRTRSAIKTPTLVTVAEAAQAVGCSQDTIRRALYRGEIRRYRLGPQVMRLNIDELIEFMRQRGE